MGLFDELTKGLGALASGSASSAQKNGLGGLLGSAAAGGLIGALLGGSKGLQRTARNAAVIGAGAGAAALAYKLYQKWQQNAAADKNTTGTMPETVSPQAAAGSSVSTANADSKALLLLEAMVFAARADGHIDAEEEQLILKSASELGAQSKLAEVTTALMHQPLDPEDLARKVSSAEEGADVYFLSAVIIKADTFMEKSYLNGLAAALGFDAAKKAELDARAEQMRSSLLQ